MSGAGDAVVVGSGPNGLAAALVLARAGLSVQVIEGAAEPGGGCRTEQLTRPGFHHDVCAAVHPLLAASPFFRETPLAGVRLLTPPTAFAHPLDCGGAVELGGDASETAAALGVDGRAYRALFGAAADRWRELVPALLAPLLRVPRHPLALARFGVPALAPASLLARAFRTPRARALLAGLAAHAMRPLDAAGTGAFALVLGMLGHAVGWPLVQGGSGAIAASLLGELSERGATLRTGLWIEDLDQLPAASATLLEVSPRGLLALAGERLPPRYARALRRYRYGPGVCKLDWALSGPVPWSAPACRRAATLHVGGSFEEIAESEALIAAGRHPERPFCIVVQASVVDPSRAPAGAHTLYAYCHVPAGSSFDMSTRIESQIERFAPGFRETILARRVCTAAEAERRDPTYVGGDINVGAATLRQSLLRPVASPDPYATPLPGVYLCSAATPPGGGVHGMCGVGAARSALRRLDRGRLRQP